MRILVVEDNLRLTELIAEGLVVSGYVTDTAPTLADAKAFLAAAEYDLIVLDITLPDGNGRDLLKAVRTRGQTLPVLVVTARLDTPHRVGTLDDGADDYLGKPFEMEELIARIRAILRRPRQMTRPVLEIANLVLDIEGLTAWVDGKGLDLSRREMSALEVLLRNRDSLVPRRKLEHALYSFDEAVTPNALEAVLSRLRRRLEQAGAGVTVTAMRGIGYILSERQ